MNIDAKLKTKMVDIHLNGIWMSNELPLLLSMLKQVNCLSFCSLISSGSPYLTLKMGREDKTSWKAGYFVKIVQLLEECPKCFIVGADNVGSRQMETICISLRGSALVLMGKNTMMRNAIRGHLEENAHLEKLLPHIRGNVGFVFTKSDLAEVHDKLMENKVRAPARAGAIAPLEVIIPAQNTGLGTEKTSFFQALSIPTFEIINDVPILRPGDKVGASEATLLNMLNISPFSYGLQIEQVYDSGSIFSPGILDIKPEVLRAKFQSWSCNFGRRLARDRIPDVPHSIANGFCNLLVIAADTEVEFKEADNIKEFIKDSSKFASVVAPAAATTAAAMKEEKKEDTESEDDDMGFGLFD